jgi:hypothetical protein
MFADLKRAYDQASDEAARRRIVDMMAYLQYAAMFRDFDLVRQQRPTRDAAYYDALRPLMQYAWRIRLRDMVHYYALARRLCNGLPVQDERLDFYMFNKEQKPVWMAGDPLTDEQILHGFLHRAKQLEEADDPHVAYSRYLEPVRPPGDDAGPCRLAAGGDEGAAAFRRRLTGYLLAGARQTVTLAVKPTGRSVTVVVYERGDDVLLEQTIRDKERFTEVAVELPRANEYRVQFTGDMLLRVAPETPFAVEASAKNPAWIDMAGPMYFYVPRGCKQVIVDGSPRLSLNVPVEDRRIDVQPLLREPGKDYTIIDVPRGASGRVWHTLNQTRGQVVLFNVPPLLSLHRRALVVPREVAEGDALTTAER